MVMINDKTVLYLKSFCIQLAKASNTNISNVIKNASN